MPADTVRVGDRDVPLAEIEAEIAAATKGAPLPWIVQTYAPLGDYDTAKTYGVEYADGEDSSVMSPDVATLIAHAPTYLTALVAEVRALPETER